MTEDWLKWLEDNIRILIEENAGRDIDLKKHSFFPQDVKDYLSGIYSKINALLEKERTKIHNQIGG